MRNAESTPALPFRISHSTFRILMHRASDFDYQLPPNLIAQDPLPDRGGSRLLVLDRAGGAVRQGGLVDAGDLVAREEVLVLSVSCIMPAGVALGAWRPPK